MADCQFCIKYVAMQTLFDSIFVDLLAKMRDPKGIGDVMTRTAFDADVHARKVSGEDDPRISEEVARLMDRAVKRAIDIKKSGKKSWLR